MTNHLDLSMYEMLHTFTYFSACLAAVWQMRTNALLEIFIKHPAETWGTQK